jgi:hypothetical protein
MSLDDGSAVNPAAARRFDAITPGYISRVLDPGRLVVARPLEPETLDDRSILGDDRTHSEVGRHRSPA